MQLEDSQARQFNIDNYNEYSLPEYNFKIKYHPDWEKTDGEDLRILLDEEGFSDLSCVVIFKPSIYYLHSSILNSLIIQVFDSSEKYSLRDYAAIQIRELKQKYPDSSIDKSNSLVISE